jgi:hypothetical protein
MTMKGTFSVFGSSRPRPGSAPYEEARLIGRLLAQAGFTRWRQAAMAARWPLSRKGRRRRAATSLG